MINALIVAAAYDTQNRLMKTNQNLFYMVSHAVSCVAWISRAAAATNQYIVIIFCLGVQLYKVLIVDPSSNLKVHHKVNKVIF